MIGMPSLDLGHILLSLGYNGNIFIGHDPDEVGTYISLRDTPGSGSNPKWLRDFVRVQIRSKAPAHHTVAGYNELFAVRNLLFGVDSVALEEVETNQGTAVRIDGKVYQQLEEKPLSVQSVTRTVDYIRFLITSDVQFITLDDNNRPIHTLNFELTRDYREPLGNRLPIK